MGGVKFRRLYLNCVSELLRLTTSYSSDCLVAVLFPNATLSVSKFKMECTRSAFARIHLTATTLDDFLAPTAFTNFVVFRLNDKCYYDLRRRKADYKDNQLRMLLPKTVYIIKKFAFVIAETMANFSKCVLLMLASLSCFVLVRGAPPKPNDEWTSAQPIANNVFAAANVTINVVTRGLRSWWENLNSPEAAQAREKVTEQTRRWLWSKKRQDSSSSSSDSSDSSSSDSSSDSSDSSESRPSTTKVPQNGTHTNGIAASAASTAEISQPVLEFQGDEADANVNVGDSPAENNDNGTITASNEHFIHLVNPVNRTTGIDRLDSFTRSLAESFRLL